MLVLSVKWLNFAIFDAETAVFQMNLQFFEMKMSIFSTKSERILKDYFGSSPDKSLTSAYT